ncbi:hypothetical protein ACWGSU_22000 [Streptomyces koyangensis]
MDLDTALTISSIGIPAVLGGLLFARFRRPPRREERLYDEPRTDPATTATAAGPTLPAPVRIRRERQRRGRPGSTYRVTRNTRRRRSGVTTTVTTVVTTQSAQSAKQDPVEEALQRALRSVPGGPPVIAKPALTLELQVKVNASIAILKREVTNRDLTDVTHGAPPPLPDLSPKELADVATAGRRSIDRSLAKLMIRLGPPPEAIARPFQPAGIDGGGRQQ